MVVLFDKAVEMVRRKPTYQRHQSLEKSEEEADGNKRSPTHTAQDDATGNGNRETIHGQADSQ